MAESFEQLPGEELKEVLRRASAYLAEAGVENPRVDAELLAAYCMSKASGESISRGRVQSLELIGAPAPEGFTDLIAERAQRIPLQHLTGVAYFRQLELAVGPGVFIPRPETEELVSRVLTEVDSQQTSPLKIVDLCTGSGAIAASIDVERPGHSVFAVELSELAIAWTTRNIVGTAVKLIHEDATRALAGHESTFDIVASNPPYIPNGAVPQDTEVREYDPQMALYGGSEDGLKIPRTICQRAAELLKPGGFLIMEHAETQRDGMRTILAESGFERIESIDDLTGRPRHTAGYLG
ncbi:peptide chain release factor N(5)-glutamine methyltransferase [Rothia amarae]|uniref:Release factor glutamine methyltransferase n=1 Tax=Rothia amarae TaxID=169480 RepID=A0A7H2BM13_9MICC|nr:peptide chain release factor N(5)-glutamine methyltransferase [Rothia amarae]QNV40709.1 peptide chain release factor N(5)-glutamine methyltransferase [Rothia amarae]